MLYNSVLAICERGVSRLVFHVFSNLCQYSENRVPKMGSQLFLVYLSFLHLNRCRNSLRPFSERIEFGKDFLRILSMNGAPLFFVKLRFLVGNVCERCESIR